MWLSFLGSFGLFYIKFKEKEKNHNFWFKMKEYILGNLYSSLAVNLLIFPIIWNSYNTISLTFFISNLLISFLIGPIIIIGYFCLFFGEYLKIIVLIENIFIIY